MTIIVLWGVLLPLGCIFVILLHNTARGEDNWVLIKRQKEIRNWGMHKAVHQSPPINQDHVTTTVKRMKWIESRQIDNCLYIYIFFITNLNQHLQSWWKLSSAKLSLICRFCYTSIAPYCTKYWCVFFFLTRTTKESHDLNPCIVY